MDDVTVLKSGHQVVADSILMDGIIEVNESLITGEPDAITKKKGDMILSGSFIVSGSCTAKVCHVGKDNYVSKISREAKYEKKVNSMIMDSFEKLLKILSILIIPIGIVMYFSQLMATDGNVTGSIFYTVAALIGMIPEGLVLLKYKVLVQHLYCIETLARVDVICLDKTGTLTEGTMKVVDYVPYKKIHKESLKNILCAYQANSSDTNATMNSLKENFEGKSTETKKNEIPFSSERKFSGIEFVENGTIYLGAPEILLKEHFKKIEPLIAPYQKENRVLLVAKSKEKLSKKPQNLEILGFVIIEDVIRKDAKETLEYFKSQGVHVKIISGDNVKTVLYIA